MQLQIDPKVPYALALEGGGAKGAYQIGAWRALREAGIEICAVSGTSVGALNGSMIAMGDLEKAENVWRNISYSKVIDVDDDTIRNIMRGTFKQLNLRTVAEQVSTALKGRGFDVTPLMNWMKEVVDDELIRLSPTELYIVTYSLSDFSVLELRAKDLPEGELCDMLLASAYLLLFRNEKLGGKRYIDGGVADVLPLHILYTSKYKNIIAIKLHGVGVKRPARKPADVTLYTIKPEEHLGSVLDFDPQRSAVNLSLGYYDTQRFLYGLKGSRYYIDSLWTQGEAYQYLMKSLRRSLENAGIENVSLRCLHERVIPAVSKQLDDKGEEYLSVALAYLEASAELAGIERFKVYTDKELQELIEEKPAVYPCQKEAAAAVKSKGKAIKLL